MNIKIVENNIDVEDFIKLKGCVNFNPQDEERSIQSINGSQYIVHAEINNQTIGMGRIVGDGCEYYYVQDVIVLPKYREQGIGKMLMQKIMQYIKNDTPKGARVTVGLFCAKGKEEFYRNFGFIDRPNKQYGPGMIMHIENK